MAFFRKAATRGPKKPEEPAMPPEQVPADRASEAPEPVAQPTSHPLVKLILGGIALRGGDSLLRRAVDRGLLGLDPGSAVAKAVGKRRSVGQTLIGTAIVRVATRSVPGAILVGGGLLVKTLYDRKRDRQAAGKPQDKQLRKETPEN